ncbi:MAG: serine/threonine protein phosphatase [Bacteroidetes bacterium]|nr:MAG: serine/threonine protein phosphatase [Bacteroidota bacterium]
MVIVPYKNYYLKIRKMNTFVIPDVHGCSKTLKMLFNKISPSKDDIIYFLGDYIDKGKDSAGVIDFIIEMQDNAYQIFALRGNHEQNLLYAYHNYNQKMFKSFVGKMNKSINLLDENGNLKEKYLNFVANLPYFIELDDFWLVHAGFNIYVHNVFDDFNGMLEIRNMEYDEIILKGKTIIHGHQVTYLDKIEELIENKSKIIALDNGCVYNQPHRKYDYTKLGNLLCLNLNNFELTIQKNID